MSAMTLEAVRDDMAFALFALDGQGDARGFSIKNITKWKESIDAAIRARRQPMAWMHPNLNEDHPFPDECLSAGEVDGWLPLYREPPAPKVTDAMVAHIQMLLNQWGVIEGEGTVRSALEAALKDQS